MEIFPSDINMRPILVFLCIWLYIWLLSPLPIVIACALLSLNLLGALIVTVAANPVNDSSIPKSPISPAFSHLRFDTLCTFFDGLYLAQTANFAQKFTKLKIRDTVTSLNETVLRHGERTLKLQLDDLSQRQRALYEAEKKMEERENDLLSRTGTMIFQQKRAQDIIAADGRKKMKELWAMTPLNQRRIDDRTAKLERMRGVITG